MRHWLSLTTFALLVACGQPEAVDNDLAGADELPSLNATEASPTGGPSANQTEPLASESAGAVIPAALQGRWGLTPGDCTSTMGDAKGLLTVEADKLGFYESRAIPSDKVQTSDDSVSGVFNYAGEGEKWSRHTTLELKEGKLIRTERNPLASFTYVRC